MKESSVICQWPLLSAMLRTEQVTSDTVTTCAEVSEFWLYSMDFIGLCFCCCFVQEARAHCWLILYCLKLVSLFPNSHNSIFLSIAFSSKHITLIDYTILLDLAQSIHLLKSLWILIFFLQLIRLFCSLHTWLTAHRPPSPGVSCFWCGLLMFFRHALFGIGFAS